MNTMVSRRFACMIVLLVLCFTGCNRTYVYSFSQWLDNVDKV